MRGSERFVLMAVLAAGALAAGAAAAEGPQPLQPGLWLETRRITLLETPHMAPGMAAAMARRPPVTSRRCITAEEARAGLREMMDRDFECPGDVRFGPGGSVDARAVCHERDGESATLRFHGRFTPVAFSMSGEGVAAGPMAMHIRTEVTGRLVGPCR